VPSTHDATPDKACALYVRRSSNGGNGSNRSLAEQEAEVRALATREGLTIVHVYAEKEGTGASRFSRKRRPQWDAALADLEAGDRFRSLVVFALDRADRRGADEMAKVIRRHAETGRRIIGVDGTDTGDPHRRMETIIRLEVAAEEVERLSSRITRTKRHRRAEGRWLGGRPPYGLAVEGGRLVRDPDTFPVARRIADALLADSTLWAVVRDLNREGVPAPVAGRLLAAAAKTEDPAEAAALTAKAHAATWQVASVAAMVKTPAWAGLQSIRKRTKSGGWAQIADVYRDPETGEPVSVGEGVVTRQERALILAALSSRTVERFQHGRTVRTGSRVSGAGSLLADVLRCETCGARPGLSGDNSHRSYRCGAAANGGARCKGYTAPLEALDGYVAARIRSRLAALEPEPGEGWHPALLAAAKVWAGEASPEVRMERARLEGNLAEAREDDARVRSLALAGVLLPEEAAVERAKTQARIRTAEEALATVGGGEPDPGALLDAASTAEAWEALDAATRRRVVAAVVERVTVAKAAARGVRFKPEERVTITWREDDAAMQMEG
jgi:DNA invertase Pin-like site-specific DNA recombinase